MLLLAAALCTGSRGAKRSFLQPVAELECLEDSYVQHLEVCLCKSVFAMIKPLQNNKTGLHLLCLFGCQLSLLAGLPSCLHQGQQLLKHFLHSLQELHLPVGGCSLHVELGSQHLLLHSPAQQHGEC